MQSRRDFVVNLSDNALRSPGVFEQRVAFHHPQMITTFGLKQSLVDESTTHEKNTSYRNSVRLRG